MRELNNYLLAFLRAIEDPGNPGHDLLVGDMTIPPGSGFPSGANMPTEDFVPYLVLMPLTATPQQGQSMGSPQSDWLCPFGIQSFGATRDQSQWIAGVVRDTLTGLKNEVLALATGKSYKVQQVYAESIGGINRVAGVNPAYFGGTDQVTLWLAKQRS